MRRARRGRSQAGREVRQATRDAGLVCMHALEAERLLLGLPASTVFFFHSSVSAGAAGGGAADVTRTADEPYAANFISLIAGRRGGDPARRRPSSSRAGPAACVGGRAGAGSRGPVEGEAALVFQRPRAAPGPRVLGLNWRSRASALLGLRTPASHQQPLAMGKSGYVGVPGAQVLS